MDLPNMTPENARKVSSLMKRHPGTFKVAQGNTSTNRPVAAAYGSLPKIGHLPSLPGFEELADNMLPDSAEELECMMNERLNDRRRLMECVVKHDALLFRIKVKMGLIRGGENERR
ncbi:hypothetical protein NM208_g13886 [Fusarium decemcellulare]|uniref:Uncharacterized protein n=1 Tax=Fusarium decemcellulare TaxID=57161 RepID=A0ACC1RI81_9HYPO|nr:hypothetical protein NM208_g13886 [Fusarium decemcellulare]